MFRRMNIFQSSTVAALAGMAISTAWAADGARAKIDSGVVVGVERGNAEVFLAIPYAAPPVGPLRWKPPMPAPHWAEQRLATDPGPACPQRVNSNGTGNAGGYNGPVSEDCLTLDVTAPKGAKHAPVMVWIYGGGNIAGATNLPSLDGRKFARDGIVLVAMNYRLGPLGFFAHPAITGEAPAGQSLGSYGLMDQIAALQWVKRNIAAFGGDPKNVTIFGESAGGIDVLSLLHAPSAKGLYKKAIVESGAGWDTPVTLAQAETKGAAVASRLGLPGKDATADQLRALPADKLIGTILEMSFPIIDGRLLKESTTQAFAQGEGNPVPLIIGSNSDEAVLMGAFGLTAKAMVDQASPELRAAYAPDAATEASEGRAMYNDQHMGGPARWIARKQSAHAPAWLYYFSYVPERLRAVRPGAAHASEIVFVFDSIDAIPGLADKLTPSERAEAEFVHSCWVAFAKSGRPDCAGAQAWPAYQAATDQLLEFGDAPSVRNHFRQAQLDAQEAAAGDTLTPQRGANTPEGPGGKGVAPTPKKEETKQMRLTTPRIPPIPQTEWNDEVKALMAGLERNGRVYNIFTTLGRNPELLRNWLVFGNHVLSKSTLPPRERELAILRMGWLCRAEYEWGHHVAIGKAAGISAEEVKRITLGPEAPGWSPFEAALLRAMDELNTDSFISDSTWKALAQRYSDQQLLDLIFTAGQYKMVCMALNSVGVQLEEGFEKLPSATAGKAAL